MLDIVKKLMVAIANSRCRKVQEQMRAIRCSRDRPFVNIPIKCIRLLEHNFKVSTAGRIPTVDVLIEGLCDVECSNEIVHILQLPLRNVLIKGKSILEQMVERAHIVHIPSQNVAIESASVQKRVAKIGHIAQIPAWDCPKSRGIPQVVHSPVTNYSARKFSICASNLAFELEQAPQGSHHQTGIVPQLALRRA